MLLIFPVREAPDKTDAREHDKFCYQFICTQKEVNEKAISRSLRYVHFLKIGQIKRCFDGISVRFFCNFLFRMFNAVNGFSTC